MVSVLLWLGTPLVLACSAGLAFGQSSGNTVVATVGDQTITVEQLESRVAHELIDARTHEYQRKRESLNGLLFDILASKEAARRGITRDELYRLEIDAKVSAVSDEELDALYSSSSARLREMPDKAAKAWIRQSVTKERSAMRKREFFRELRAGVPVMIALSPPRLSLQEGQSPTRGPAGAPIVIFEYADFECPYCARAARTLEDLERRYPGKLRRVFKNFPLSNHRQAARAAEVALCSAEQGRFWEVYRRLFENQRNLTSDAYHRIATEVGLDIASFSSCLESGRAASLRKSDEDEAKRFKMDGTPFFFINGRLLNGAQPIDAFVEVIEEELARRTASASVASREMN